MFVSLAITAMAAAMPTAAAIAGFHSVSGRGYSFELPNGWGYWRKEMGANWVEYFYRDPAIPWSVMTIEPDGC